MSDQNIKLTKDGYISTITFTDPKGLNLFKQSVLEELAVIQEEVSKDKECRALILNSSGPHFSCGADIAFLKTVDARFIKDNLTFIHRVFSRFQEFPMAVIAAIKGFCLGGGLELALSCDIRVVAENASLSMPEVRFGLAADQTGTTRLTKLVGTGQAKKIALFTETLDAAEAYRIGLCEYLVKPEELDNKVNELARKVINLPPSGVRMAKWGINVAAEGNTYASLMFEQAQSMYCFSTEDKIEATESFIEKRKPVFKDK